MHNATPVLPFKTRRPTRRHYFLRVNFRPFSCFTCTARAKINPGCDSVSVVAELLVCVVTVCSGAARKSSSKSGAKRALSASSSSEASSSSSSSSDEDDDDDQSGPSSESEKEKPQSGLYSQM